MAAKKWICRSWQSFFLVMSVASASCTAFTAISKKTPTNLLTRRSGNGSMSTRQGEFVPSVPLLQATNQPSSRLDPMVKRELNFESVEEEKTVGAEKPLLDATSEDLISKGGKDKASLAAQERPLSSTAKNLMAPFVAALFVLASIFLGPLQAQAIQSGGRMGGSFGGRSTYSSRPTTQIYSSPSSSYNRGFSRGFSSGYYSPSPFFAPSPFYSPFYGPSYYGGGVTVVPRGPSLFSFVGTAGAVLFSAFVWNSIAAGLDSGLKSATNASSSSALGAGTSAVAVSVALDVPNRDDPNSILNVLNHLARKAKTDSRVGVQNLMSQVSVELLRRKSSFIAASSSYRHFSDPTQAQQYFDRMSVKERSKFEQETVNKYGGVDYNIGREQKISVEGSSKATVAVVTLLLVIDGDSTKVPNIRSAKDVESALSRIASDVKVEDCLRSAEILWTPEERSEVLTRKDVVADYPHLWTI